MDKIFGSALLLLLKAYQVVVSPALHLIAGPGQGCRFEPTCSQYAIQAVQRHGAWFGSRLALKRFGRCHPFGKVEGKTDGGFDPVPPAKIGN